MKIITKTSNRTKGGGGTNIFCFFRSRKIFLKQNKTKQKNTQKKITSRDLADD